MHNRALTRRVVLWAALALLVPSARPQQKERVEVLFVELGPSGFTPAQVTRPAGRVQLYVRNTTGLADLDLRLGRGGNGNADRRDFKATLSQRHWREIVQLAQGEYTITEASRPTWQLRITVTR